MADLKIMTDPRQDCTSQQATGERISSKDDNGNRLARDFGALALVSGGAFFVSGAGYHSGYLAYFGLSSDLFVRDSHLLALDGFYSLSVLLVVSVSAIATLALLVAAPPMLLRLLLIKLAPRFYIRIWYRALELMLPASRSRAQISVRRTWFKPRHVLPAAIRREMPNFSNFDVTSIRLGVVVVFALFFYWWGVFIGGLDGRFIYSGTKSAGLYRLTTIDASQSLRVKKILCSDSKCAFHDLDSHRTLVLTNEQMKVLETSMVSEVKYEDLVGSAAMRIGATLELAFSKLPWLLLIKIE